MCVSVLIVCLENKHHQSYLLLKVIVTTTFQWLFAERFFHHQDGLKSRTLFVIPHKLFWGIMLPSFFKRVTPYSSINQVQVQTKQIQVVEVSKHTQTTKYAPRDSTFSCVMLRWTSPKLGLMKNFDPFLKKSDMNANERSGSCDSKRPFLSSRFALSGKFRNAGRDSSFKWVVPDRFVLPIHVWTLTQ